MHIELFEDLGEAGTRTIEAFEIHDLEDAINHYRVHKGNGKKVTLDVWDYTEYPKPIFELKEMRES